MQSCKSLTRQPDWQLEGLQPPEQAEADEYAIPDYDQNWPMLVELCSEVYQAQGHVGAHQWIEMLPESYRLEMWAELEKLDTPKWLQEQNDYSADWALK